MGFSGLRGWDWGKVDAVDVGSVGELGASEVAGDDASAAANVKDGVWIGNGCMNNAVVGKGDEGEVLMMEAGVLCWADGKGNRQLKP